MPPSLRLPVINVYADDTLTVSRPDSGASAVQPLPRPDRPPWPDHPAAQARWVAAYWNALTTTYAQAVPFPVWVDVHDILRALLAGEPLRGAARPTWHHFVDRVLTPAFRADPQPTPAKADLPPPPFWHPPRAVRKAAQTACATWNAFLAWCASQATAPPVENPAALRAAVEAVAAPHPVPAAAAYLAWPWRPYLLHYARDHATAPEPAPATPPSAPAAPRLAPEDPAPLLTPAVAAALWHHPRGMPYAAHCAPAGQAPYALRALYRRSVGRPADPADAPLLQAIQDGLTRWYAQTHAGVPPTVDRLRTWLTADAASPPGLLVTPALAAALLARSAALARLLAGLAPETVRNYHRALQAVQDDAPLVPHYLDVLRALAQRLRSQLALAPGADASAAWAAWAESPAPPPKGPDPAPPALEPPPPAAASPDRATPEPGPAASPEPAATPPPVPAWIRALEALTATAPLSAYYQAAAAMAAQLPDRDARHRWLALWAWPDGVLERLLAVEPLLA